MLGKNPPESYAYNRRIIILTMLSILQTCYCLGAEDRSFDHLLVEVYNLLAVLQAGGGEPGPAQTRLRPAATAPVLQLGGASTRPIPPTGPPPVACVG